MRRRQPCRNLWPSATRQAQHAPRWEQSRVVEDPKACVAGRRLAMGKVAGAEATGPCRVGPGKMAWALFCLQRKARAAEFKQGGDITQLTFLSCSCTVQSPEELLERSTLGPQVKPVKSERIGNCRSQVFDKMRREWDLEPKVGGEVRLR